MAEAFFNKYVEDYKAISAGTSGTEFKGKLSDFSNNVVPVMLEVGIDVSQKRTKQLTKETVDSVDKIIVMIEREHCPKYLLDSDKEVFWNIEGPRSSDLDFHRKIRDQIKEKVERLINELDN